MTKKESADGVHHALAAIIEPVLRNGSYRQVVRRVLRRGRSWRGKVSRPWSNEVADELDSEEFADEVLQEAALSYANKRLLKLIGVHYPRMFSYLDSGS